MQYLAMLVVAHSAYSLLRWRKFLVAENQFSGFSVPSDVHPVELRSCWNSPWGRCCASW